MKESDSRTGIRRGVYIIPTSLTVLNIFFGFVAILFAMRGMQQGTLGLEREAAHFFRLACWSIGAAAIFDTFDGLVARLMNATSEFGKEYDSIADVVTFGAAPAVLVYSWALSTWGRLGGGIAFLFLVAGSMRLARFNIQTAKVDHRWFVGLPIPAAALTICATINYAPLPVSDRAFSLVIMLLTAGLAFAMVSTVRYRSQKYTSLLKRKSFTYLIGIALLLVVMFRWPEEFFFVGFVAYAASGPMIRLWHVAFPSGVLEEDEAGTEEPGDADEGDELVPGEVRSEKVRGER